MPDYIPTLCFVALYMQYVHASEHIHGKYLLIIQPCRHCIIVETNVFHENYFVLTFS